MSLRNRTLTKVNDGTTPDEHFHRMKLDVGQIHTFGCIVRVTLPSEKLPLPLSASMAMSWLSVQSSLSHHFLLDSCVFILSESLSSHGDQVLPLWRRRLGEWHIGRCVGGARPPDASVLTGAEVIECCQLFSLLLWHWW